MRTKLTLLLYLCLCPFWASAQDDSYTYSEAAGSNSLIFRNRMAPQYIFRHNGTHFWENGDFILGNVLYNGKLYNDIYLNIDAYSQQVLAKSSLNVSAVALPTEYVSSFNRGKEKFVNLKANGCEDAPDGFFCILYDGKTKFLLQTRRLLRNETGNKNGKPIGYVDPDYKENVTDYFAISQTWWILRGGKLTQIKTKGDFLSLYDKEDKKDIKKHCKNLHPDGTPPSFQEFCVEALNYMHE